MKYNKISFRFLNFFALLMVTALCVASISAQSEQSTNDGKKQKLNNKFSKKLPLKVEIENAETEDLLSTIKITITNKGQKPIYYLNFSLILNDVLSPTGERIGFPLGYGRPELASFGEIADSTDDPLLKNESHVFTVSVGSINSWRKAQKKLKLAEPTTFDLQFHLLSFGDGSGVFGSTAQPYSGKAKKDPSDGSIRKGSLVKESDYKKLDFEKKTKNPKPQSIFNLKSEKISGFSFALAKGKPKSCSPQSDVGKVSFFSGFIGKSKAMYEFPKNSADGRCGCSSSPSGCNWQTLVSNGCCPYPESNAYVLTAQYSSDCSAPEYNCGVAESYIVYCEGGSPETGNGCHTFYLEFCGSDSGCGASEICGNGIDDNCNGDIDEFCPTGGGGGGGGGDPWGGGGCTPYYWVYYLSYDGGETWEIDDFEYAGCW